MSVVARVSGIGHGGAHPEAGPSGFAQPTPISPAVSSISNASMASPARVFKHPDKFIRPKDPTVKSQQIDDAFRVTREFKYVERQQSVSEGLTWPGARRDYFVRQAQFLAGQEQHPFDKFIWPDKNPVDQLKKTARCAGGDFTTSRRRPREYIAIHTSCNGTGHRRLAESSNRRPIDASELRHECPEHVNFSRSVRARFIALF